MGLKLEQHQNGQNAENRDQNAVFQCFYTLSVQCHQMCFQQYQAEFCHFAHLQCGQMLNVDPPAAVADGLHKQHHHQQKKAQIIKWPRPLADPPVIYAGHYQRHHQARYGIQRLGQNECIAGALAKKSRCIAGAEQHQQAEDHQDHQIGKIGDHKFAACFHGIKYSGARFDPAPGFGSFFGHFTLPLSC